ncbi:hypothetical protein ES703_40451 [subsurface metagenome]
MAKAKQIETLPVEPLLLRAEQAAKLCGLSVSTWHEYRTSGRIPPSIKIGKARLWRLDILRRWCQENCPTIDRFNQLLTAEGKK